MGYEGLCEYCHQKEKLKSGKMVEFSFVYKTTSCTLCNEFNNFSWKFIFCNLDHFLLWLKEKDIENKGVPCRDCAGTGSLEEGPKLSACPICKGKGLIREPAHFDLESEVFGELDEFTLNAYTQAYGGQLPPHIKNHLIKNSKKK
jgi:hypothetical protein